MISKKMVDELANQMNKEMFSAYFYLGMSAYARSTGFKGIANWFYSQAKEEMFHAEKFYNYINEQGKRVMLEAIDKPDQDFSSPVELFDKTLAHEKKVTAMIHGLVDLAKKENDEKTGKFLEWFVKEQMEEEATPGGILQKLKAVEKDEKGILSVDAELAKRV